MGGDQKLSSSSRTSSASSAASLRGTLSKLRTTHLRPVEALRTSVDFVPARIPRKRRLQTFVVAVWSVLIPLCVVVWLILASYPPLWPVLAAYLVWMAFIDKSPEHGGRLSPWFRRMSFWKYFADYYPSSNVIFQLIGLISLGATHMASIISIGAMCTFGTEATGWSTAFPGIRPHLLTLTANFRIPLYRDILMALGICSVSKTSCSNILRQGAGAAITIVVGGAAESLAARPGTADLTLRRRLGFIKIAIQHGADLVPVFSFGENDIYNQMPNEPGTTVYALQKKFQSVFGFTLPLFHGRGLLNYNLGLLPYRRRIVSVIGRPIHVTKSEKPSLEEVLEIQRRYIEELTRIWDTYKDQLAKLRRRELIIVD